MSEKALPLCPVYLYEEGIELPEKGMYYVVAQNGIFIHVERQVGSALVKADGIPWLAEAEPSISLKLPVIPGRIVAQAHAFFRMVFEKYGAESYVQLYYSKELGQYRLWCPKQEVSRGGVSYDRADQFAYEERVGDAKDISKEWKWQMVGTIHSHCDFSAFHSSTDTGDEETFDGIHITIGHVNKDEPSMVASVAVNANRLPLEPENCISDIVRQTTKKSKYVKYMTMNYGDVHFAFELSPEDEKGLQEDVEMIEQEWMPKVSKRVFFDSWRSKRQDEEGQESDGWEGFGGYGIMD